MDAESGTSQATRSQKRLDKYVKAMGFLKQLVIGRWKAAVQQEKQQREEREKAEAAERATAAAAAEAQRALHAKVQELTRERGALRDEMYEVRQARVARDRAIDRLRAQHRYEKAVDADATFNSHTDGGITGG
jgi:predicted RNase H-like nuclease (RuvC/YqgF family)